MTQRDPVPTTRAALREALNKALDDNRDKIQILARMGASIDPRMVLMTRLDTLIDLMLLDPKKRLQFDLLFETRMGGILEAAISERRKVELLSGVSPSGQGAAPRLIVPQ
jgi:hypothetical protein